MSIPIHILALKKKSFPLVILFLIFKYSTVYKVEYKTTLEDKTETKIFFLNMQVEKENKMMNSTLYIVMQERKSQDIIELILIGSTIGLPRWHKW